MNAPAGRSEHTRTADAGADDAVRVLIVHNHYRSDQPSGENGVVEEEAQLLADAGHHVSRLDVHSDDIAGWPTAKRALVPARVVWSRDGERLMRRAIAERRPQIVHAHNTFPLLSPASLRAAGRSGVKVVNTLHNFRALCPSANFFRDGRVCEDCLGRAPLPALRHACYRSSRVATAPIVVMDTLHTALGTWRRYVDTFIAPSQFALDTYVRAGWPADQFAVKYNTARDLPERRTGAGDGFVCLSRLVTEKGVEVLLRAWAKAFPEGGQTLTVVGSGELGAPLRGLASQLELMGVEFRGQVTRPEALELMRSARAVVMPSLWYEVFPRTVVEAYSLGVPVIASDLGSLAEVVEDEITGLHFEPGSAASLAQALVSVARSDQLTQRLGHTARAVYEQRYSPAATTDRLVEIYRQALGHPARGVPEQRSAQMEAQR